MMLLVHQHLVALWVAVHMLFTGSGNDRNVHESNRQRPPHIVFLISKDSLNYEADVTIPVYARYLEESFGFETTVLLGQGERAAFRFNNIEVLNNADLLVVFCRRVALEPVQFNIIRNYLQRGKPVMGIRTANHAFSFLEQPQKGFEAWPAFVDSVLGCKNRGYGPVVPGTDITVAPGASHHSILKNISADQWHSKGNVYLVAPLLDSSAEVLLMGRGGEYIQPVAWARHYGRSRVFYTSMGYPDDFALPQFRQLLINGIHWALQIE